MDFVLIHGMGRTPVSMFVLRRRLRKAGHNPILFGYWATFETLDGASRRLARLIESKFDQRPYAVVGHSLGTVVFRNALPHLQNRQPSICFFMTPPMVACKAACFFSRYRLYRIITGDMGMSLADEQFMSRLLMPSCTTRIYAGIAGPRAWWLPFGDELNDGVLSVTEAGENFAADLVKVRSIHTFVMNSKQVVEDMLESVKQLEAHRAPPERQA